MNNAMIREEGIMLLAFIAYIIILLAGRESKKTQYIKAAVTAIAAILVETVFDMLPYWIDVNDILIEYSLLQWTVTNIAFVLAVGIIYRLSCKESSKLWALYKKRFLPVKIGVLLLFLLGIWLTVLDCRHLLASMAAIKERIKSGNMDYMLFSAIGELKSGYAGFLRIVKILIPGFLMADFIAERMGRSKSAKV